MARNLVEEKRHEERAKASEEAETKKTEETTETKIAVNQVEAIIINRIDILTAIVLEGFRQVGAKFEDKEAK